MGLAAKAKAKPARFAPQQRLCFQLQPHRPVSAGPLPACPRRQLRTTRQFWPDPPSKLSRQPSPELPTPDSRRLPKSTQTRQAPTRIRRHRRTARPPNREFHEPRAPRLCHRRDTAHLRPPIPLAHTCRRTRVDTRAVATLTPGLLAGGCGPGPFPAARRDAVGKGEGGRGARAKGKGEFGPPGPDPLFLSRVGASEPLANLISLLAACPILPGASRVRTPSPPTALAADHPPSQ